MESTSGDLNGSGKGRRRSVRGNSSSAKVRGGTCIGERNCKKEKKKHLRSEIECGFAPLAGTS